MSEVAVDDPSSDPLRARLLAYVKERTGSAGKHTVVSTRALGAQFSVKPVTISKHLRALQEEGYLHTKPAGPRGTIIVLDAGPRRSGGRRPATPATPGLRPVGKTPFCPWCGSTVQKPWHFCNRCGGELPK